MPKPLPAGMKPWGPNNPPPRSPGRPRKRPLSEAYEEWMRAPVPKKQLAALLADGIKLPANPTNADLVALQMGKKAIKGDVNAARLIGEFVEGKPTQRIEMATADRGFEVSVSYAAPLKKVEQLEDQVVEKILETTAVKILEDGGK
jgi:hypothetical protein